MKSFSCTLTQRESCLWCQEGSHLFLFSCSYSSGQRFLGTAGAGPPSCSKYSTTRGITDVVTPLVLSNHNLMFLQVLVFLCPLGSQHSGSVFGGVSTHKKDHFI